MSVKNDLIKETFYTKDESRDRVSSAALDLSRLTGEKVYKSDIYRDLVESGMPKIEKRIERLKAKARKDG